MKNETAYEYHERTESAAEVADERGVGLHGGHVTHDSTGKGIPMEGGHTHHDSTPGTVSVAHASMREANAYHYGHDE